VKNRDWHSPSPSDVAIVVYHTHVLLVWFACEQIASVTAYSRKA